MDLSHHRYGVLPGAFNPPTEAHLALARAAFAHVDRVIFVLPRTLPHKSYAGVPFETRLELLKAATAGEPRFVVTDTAGGLFIDIARELKAALPPNAGLHFLCGCDAAERIVNWDYGTPGAFEAMLEEFGLLVAPRGADYFIDDRHKPRIANIDLAPAYQAMSATEVRERIRHGQEWQHLVPPSIHDRVRSLYSAADESNTR